jgi:microcystin-dependent protein
VAEPFLSEIRIMSFNFSPKGWALCNGQVLPINQNQALFALLGTTYGGNGQTTFALPDLQGRVPIHMGNGFTLGQTGGETSHTLNTNELPQHFHFAVGSTTAGDTPTPAGRVLALTPSQIYGKAVSLTTLTPTTIALVGGSQAHDNMEPYLTLSFCIALQGIFPSRN